IVEAAASAEVHRRFGTVVRASGEMAIAAGVNLRPNELAFIEDPAGRMLAAECAGTHGVEAHLAMLDRGTIVTGSRVIASGRMASAPTGHALLGRVLDGLGRPIDGGGELAGTRQAHSIANQSCAACPRASAPSMASSRLDAASASASSPAPASARAPCLACSRGAPPPTSPSSPLSANAAAKCAT